MKKWISWIASIAIASSITTAAWAHDGWSQVNSPIIAQGEVSYVELMLGNHSNNHSSYRIEGRWSMPTTKVFVTTPQKKKVDITGTAFYTGEEVDTTEPGQNNYYVSTFSSSQPGAYIVSVEGDSIFKHGEVASRTLRSAKSFVAVADLPVMQRVKDLKGFSRQVSPDRAELVPQFNPVAVKPGQKVSVKLFLKGKPLAGTDITLIRRSNSQSSHYKTDANGAIQFTTGPADYYLLRAKPTTDEKREGEFDSTNYEATMTFVVQNGKSTSVATAGNKPIVYVNGKAVDEKSVVLKNGTVYVNADVLRKLDATYKGKGIVPLRAEAEKRGAIVEYFAPVGTTRSMVCVYSVAK